MTPASWEPRCDHRRLGDRKRCKNPAVYYVARIGRKYDAQDSCRKHLARTIDALAEGQAVIITVTLKEAVR